MTRLSSEKGAGGTAAGAVMETSMSKLMAVAAFGLGAGMVLATARIAPAQDLELHLGRDGPRVIQRDRDDDRGRDLRRDHRRGDCDPDEARDAARDEGFRHPRIVRMTDRTVIVEGMTRDGPDRIIFANRRGCPEIR